MNLNKLDQIHKNLEKPKILDEICALSWGPKLKFCSEIAITGPTSHS